MYGVTSPKRILLVGIQGIEKSLSAQSVSKKWKLPLLKLDIGKVIDISEGIEPCIL
uniref:Uncharacterized protein n=1 Tax=Polysiphonia infestans TaxID=2006978 RepID=A0A1Z1ME76_9FLOR|nr:hypothetical protein [Polysiphonia infestans]ARW64263.1 hypothetical protein [Polysiphonia infestans]